MKRLKHIGPGYHGTLPDGGTVFAKTNETVEVNEAKAEQLLADFPGEWVEGDAAATEQAEPSEDAEGADGKTAATPHAPKRRR